MSVMDVESKVGPDQDGVQAGYPAPGTPYDEFWASAHEPRPDQRRLLEYVETRTPADLRRLNGLVLRRIREQEVTFNILGLPDGTNRPWRLETLPLVLSHTEFVELGRGLSQRARVLNAMLADIHGEQRLVKDGIVPPQIVFGNPNFWRACKGLLPLGGHHLHLYAADVGRSPDGTFRVFSDRTAAPAGAGYALENRLVLGRTLHELFRDYAVLKINGFYQGLGRMVERLAPQGTSEPRVVMLTPGMHDESSFEHAYLARYLGFELVEGRDLTVRDNTVFMKTLAGLRRVDVILRRVYDGFCDPLELYEDSGLGVAGLVDAARAGRVAIANALGSGIVESPAFKAFLPQVSRYLFGEDLILSSVETRWLGDEQARSEVFSSLDQWVVKSAFSERREDYTESTEAHEQLLARLRARPENFVAERWPELSVAQLWEQTSLAPKKIALRMFLGRDYDDFNVLPGALARVDSAPDGMFLRQASEGSTVDVWVPSPSPEAESTLPAMPERALELRRGGVDLPSRLLDDVYWLGRYTERSDNIARLVRAGLERCGLEAAPDAPLALRAIIDALQRLEVLPPSTAILAEKDIASAVESMLLGVVFDPPRGNNMRATLSSAHQLTQRVRSRLSRDAWAVLRQLADTLEDRGVDPEDIDADTAIEILEDMLVTLSAVNGTSFENMVRGHVWLFMDMGRRVERGVFVVILLQTMLKGEATRNRMETVLDVCDSLLTYRSRYLSSLQPAPVVDLLLTDRTNPRGLLYQVDALRSHIEDLPRASEAQRGRAEQKMIALQSSLLTADVQRACAGDGSGLWELLEAALNLLWQFSDDLTTTYFSHSARSHALAPPSWINEDLEAG